MRGLQWLQCMLCVCVLLLTTDLWCEASQYQVIITDMQDFTDINNDGTAISGSCVWRDGVATQVAAPESGSMFGCVAINDSGQVIGTKQTFDPVTNRMNSSPFLWQDGVFSLLDVNSQLSSRFVRAADINDRGQILLGTGSIGSSIYFDGQLIPVPIGCAAAINNSGEVVGYITGEVAGYSGLFHANIWKDGTVTYMPPSPFGNDSFGVDVNDSGQVLGYGYALTADEHYGYSQGFIWQDGSVIQMGYLPGALDMEPVKINKYGVAVGFASSGLPFGKSAFVWQNGELSQLPNPFSVGDYEARGINDNGVICGYGTDANGFTHGVIWQPIPEPSSLLTLVTGIGGLGGLMWRRRR
jgi:uncharacterized membrane protein